MFAQLRSAGNAATVRALSRRSWWRELLDPSPRIEVPDAARRLKGKERAEAREKNTEAYWRDPGVAAEAFEKIEKLVHRGRRD